MASILQASTGKADSLLTAAQGAQDTTNAKKLRAYANIVTADSPSVVRTVIFHMMKEQRNEERDRALLAVYGLPENERDERF